MQTQTHGVFLYQCADHRMKMLLWQGMPVEWMIDIPVWILNLLLHPEIQINFICCFLSSDTILALFPFTIIGTHSFLGFRLYCYCKLCMISINVSHCLTAVISLNIVLFQFNALVFKCNLITFKLKCKILS